MLLPIPKRLNPIAGTGVAIGSVALSWGLRYLIWSLSDMGPYVTLYWAVFFSAWAGGFWAGMVATITSALCAQFLVVQPLFTFRTPLRYDLMGTIMFVLTGTLTSFLCEALRQATEGSLKSAEKAEASALDAQIAREREKAILESIADGFIAFDDKWRIQFVNEPVSRILGHRRAELLGTHMVSLHPNTVLSESAAKMRKAIESRAAEHFEFKDETHGRWYGCSAYPSISGVSLFIRDISESRKLVETVRESEERFRTMADSAPLLVWTTTWNGERDYVNAPFLQFTGRAYEQELGDGWLALVHPDDRARVRAAYEAAAEGRTSLAIEYRLRRHDGEYRWLLDSGAPRISPRGEYLGSVGSCLDITDRRHTEESLRESEARLRLSMRASQMGIWHEDLRTRTMTFSPELERIIGYDPGSAPRLAEFAASIIHPDDRQRVIDTARPAVTRGGEYEVEFRIFRSDSETRWLLVRGKVLLDNTNFPTAMSGIAIDITERKQFEERVQHAQKLESMGVLAGGIAHDFNNLLTGIMGNASLVLEDLEPDSFPWELQRNVLEASERAAQLTNQMLAYSGKGRFVVEPLNLERLIRSNFSLMQASIQNKKVELKLAHSGEPSWVEADPAQIQQLVMNLVLNGAEAIPEDRPGTVRVSLSTQEISSEDLDIEPGSYVRLEVQDTGVGMNSDTRSRIFDPFFTTKFTGRGLGLAAVQGIVRGHRGSINVDSTLGQGTRFEILLPRLKSAIPVFESESRPTWRSDATILVVDDEEMVRKTATATLERFGYQVVLAENGLRAVDIFRREPDRFDAVLLDMTMPVMNGQEALPMLKQIRPDVRVIVCSGYSEVEATERFASDGLDAFIQKPYTSAQLAEKVRAVTSGI